MHTARSPSFASFTNLAEVEKPEQSPAPEVPGPLPERPLEPPVPLPGSPPQPEPPPIHPPATDGF